MHRGRRRRTALARAALASAAAVAVAAGVAGCGGSSGEGTATPAAAEQEKAELVAVARPDDAENADSSPLPDGESRGPAAPKPDVVGEKSAEKAAATEPDEGYGISPGAPSDAEIRAELGEMKQAQKTAKRDALRAGPAGTLELTPGGNARVPEGAPKAIAAIIGSANAIARFPYVYGGGHGSFVDTAYDCSGSVSYALAGAALVDAPMTSGAFEDWGEPGPGRWVTIYANAGHMFMNVAGTRFDTSGRSGVLGSRWNASPRSLSGFTVRHPKGL